MSIVIFLIFSVVSYLVIGSLSILGGYLIHRLLPGIALGFAVVTSTLITITIAFLWYKWLTGYLRMLEETREEEDLQDDEEAPPNKEDYVVITPADIENLRHAQSQNRRSRRRK